MREPARHPAHFRAGARRLLALALLLSACAAVSAVAQGSGHTVFGDFKIDESNVNGDDPQPASFHVLLYTTTGRMVGRQTVTNNGRYRFLDVPNGEYDIVVELENYEVARLRIHLAYSYRTDHRQDIQMEARPASPGGKAAGGPRTVSAAGFYKRAGANEALLKKAEKALEKNDYEGAASLLRLVVDSDPKDFPVWTELGTILFASKNYAEAEKAYLRAIEEQPAFAPAMVSLGRLRLSQKNFDGAVEVLARAVQAQPSSPTAQFLLGEAYLQIKKGSKAVVHLNEALRLDPVGKADAHLRLAALYNAAGLKDRAADEYEQFLRKRPQHPDRKKLEQYVAENKKK
jgi:tetratricopeptide (TPR) repeat protein